MQFDIIFPDIKKSAGNTFFIPDYSMCLCLSGTPYIDCCKSIIDNLPAEVERDFKALSDANGVSAFLETMKRPKPRSTPDKKMLGVKMEQRAKDRLKFCFVEKVFGEKHNFGICDNIIAAHTISQKNLKNGTDNSHEYLYTFHDHAFIEHYEPDAVDLYYKKAPIRQLSKFHMYCHSHDDSLFKDIEKDNVIFSSKDNEYIEVLEYSINAASFEVYYKLLQIFYFAEYFKKDKNGQYDKIAIQIYNQNFLSAYKQSIDNFKKFEGALEKLLIDYKKYKDERYINKGLNYRVVKLPIDKIDISLSECFKDNGYNKPIIFANIINQQNPYIILSTYGKFSDFIKFEDCVELLDYVLINSTNAFFNKRFFENLSDEDKNVLFEVRRLGFINENITNISRKLLKIDSL